MRPVAVDLLSHYAASHRDQRNITTHFVGIPAIVFGFGVLLAKPAVAVPGWPAPLLLTPAWCTFALAVAWYLTRGNLVLGATVSALVGVLVLLAHQVAGGGTAQWLTWGAGAVLLGWMLQALGHWYEGKRPAHAGSLALLLTGPMFITAEAMFARGWNPAMLAEIERRAGPTFLRDMAV